MPASTLNFEARKNPELLLVRLDQFFKQHKACIVQGHCYHACVDTPV